MLAGQLCGDQHLHSQKCSPNSWEPETKEPPVSEICRGCLKNQTVSNQEEGERGNTALTTHRENKHSSDPAEMTVKSKMWAARVVVISNKKTKLQFSKS